MVREKKVWVFVCMCVLATYVRMCMACLSYRMWGSVGHFPAHKICILVALR